MDEVRQENPKNTGKVELNKQEFGKVMKKYKKIKKYMKSNLFQVKMMDGTEKLVTELTKEANEIENN